MRLFSFGEGRTAARSGMSDGQDQHPRAATGGRERKTGTQIAMDKQAAGMRRQRGFAESDAQAKEIKGQASLKKWEDEKKAKQGQEDADAVRSVKKDLKRRVESKIKSGASYGATNARQAGGARGVGEKALKNTPKKVIDAKMNNLQG